MRQNQVRGMWRIAALLSVVIGMTSCGADLHSGGAGNARRQASDALAQAQQIGVPPAQLAPLQQQRDAIDGQRGWFGISDATASGRYTALLAATQQAERDATTQAQAQAQRQVDALTASIQQHQATMFQARLDTLKVQLAQAATPHAYSVVEQDALLAQHTISAMLPARDAIGQIQRAIDQLHGVGLPTDLAAAHLTSLQHDFDQAQNPASFDLVTTNAQADLVAIAADQAQSIPYLAGMLVRSLHDRVGLLQTYGETTTAFQQNVTQAQTTLPTVSTLTRYQSFTQQVQSQLDAMTLPLARGQARHDLAQLRSLIDYGHQHNVMTYEYEGDWGLLDVQQRFDGAVSLDDFRAIDNETLILITNLRAMFANLADGTPYNQAHIADAGLMGYYHVQTGRAIVVSLREQVLRAYENGQLVLAFFITTGRPELPSPPGFTHITARLSPTVFTSTAPKGSAFYYNPTVVNYALLFHDGGYFIHDAWWRLQFGPGSNLPHYDPDAFNGGSHGCVNVPKDQMAQLYAWAPNGTPVILY